MSLTALVVEDEPLAREALTRCLTPRPDVEVIGECSDGEEAIRAIRSRRPHLVFLDIALPDMDAFAIVERIGVDAMPLTIFVTAYGHHAVRAFDVDALHYVTKPFTPARIDAALERALAAHAGARHLPAPVNTPPRSVPAGFAKRLLVKDGEAHRVVPVEAVLWFEGARNFVKAHTATESHLLATTLRTLEQRLDPEVFTRCHRSAIVKLAAVREIHPWFGGDLVAFLDGGARVRVSRTHRSRLLADPFAVGGR